MKQHYAVGQYLRKRYIEGQPYRLLNEFYDRYQVSFVVYTVFQKKLDPLLFHHIFALPATNCMKISRSTQEVLLVVNME